VSEYHVLRGSVSTVLTATGFSVRLIVNCLSIAKSFPLSIAYASTKNMACSLDVIVMSFLYIVF